MPKTATKSPPKSKGSGFMNKMGGAGSFQKASGALNKINSSSFGQPQEQDLRNSPEASGIKSKAPVKMPNLVSKFRGRRAALRDARRDSVIRQGLDAAKGVADQKLKQAAWANAADTFGLSVVAYYGVKHWKVTITIIIALFLLLFTIFDSSTFDPPPDDQNTPQIVSNETCTPPKIPLGQTSVCTITVTYAGSADNITIVDTILPGTEYVSSKPHGQPAGTPVKTVTWDAKQLKLPLNPVNISVKITLRATKDNVTAYNPYDITPLNLVAAGGGGAPIPGNLPPNANTCSGIYAHYMSIEPSHMNYGDPSCSLVKKDPNGVAIIDKDAILKELQTLKPSEAMGWWICVVPNESGYNANAYLRASTSGFGAYGLVQMNPTGKGNTPSDNGEVVWPLQLSNGINYNEHIGHTFAYWPTSYDPCLRHYGVTVN